MIPGLGGLMGGGFTGGAATATSGPAQGTTSGSGISSPVVIGGYKTDGTASGGVLPAWFTPAAAIVGALLIGWRLLRRK